MRYLDGQEVKLGDVLEIDEKDDGVVVANLEASSYAEGYSAKDWAYLQTGLLVQTKFGGLVHYPDIGAENFSLKERG